MCLRMYMSGLHIFNGLLDHCRQNSELDVNTALESLVKYTCLSSPSKTLYLLEVSGLMCMCMHASCVNQMLVGLEQREV